MPPKLQLNTGEEVAVGKILCVVRNYPSMAREMGTEVPREPVFFLKPSSAVVGDGGPVVLPRRSRMVVAEGELAVVIANECRRLPAEEVSWHILGYAAALDITARDLQLVAQQKGYPWSQAKGYDSFFPMSEVAVAWPEATAENLELTTKLNGVVAQRTNTNAMVFKVPELIAAITQVMTLERGDVISTGTPEGPPRLKEGDVVEVEIPTIGSIRVNVRPEAPQ